MRSPRVLVLRALGLGDLLAGVPALRALRRGFPDHEVVLAAPAELAPVALESGAVDLLLPASAPGRAVPSTLDWTGPPPDLAVDLHGNGPPSHRLLQTLPLARAESARRDAAFVDPYLDLAEKYLDTSMFIAGRMMKQGGGGSANDD